MCLVVLDAHLHPWNTERLHYEWLRRLFGPDRLMFAFSTSAHQAVPSGR